MNPIASTDLEIQDSAGEVLVHDHRHGKIHVLNGSAATVLQLCDGSRDLDAIVRDAGGEGHEGARGDIASIIEQFRSLGLIQPAASESA